MTACVPRLARGLEGHAEAEIDAALRRALAAAPAFVTSDGDRLIALLSRLVENELWTGAAPARAAPGVGAGAAGSDLPPAGPLPLPLDLDLGAGDPSQRSMVTKLALLLLPPPDRLLVTAHWSGLRAGTDAVARDRARALQEFGDIKRCLEVGAVEDALAVGSARPRAADPWGRSTQWSMVLGAVATHDPHRVQQSWQRLLTRYEAPIRRAIERALGGRSDSDELAAEFFSYLYERDVLAKVQPQGGKFRAYIQAVLRNFLHQHWRRRPADRELAEQDVDVPAAAPADAEAANADEREWAAHVLQLALRRLLRHHPRNGEILLRYYGLPQPLEDGGTTAAAPAPEPREAIAAAMGMSLAAVDQATHRARQVLRQHLERELGETVDGADAFAAESAFVARRLLEAYPGLL